MARDTKSGVKHGSPSGKPKRSRSLALTQEQQDNLLAVLFGNLEVGVAYLLPSGEIVYSNSHFASVLGVPAQRKLSGHSLREFIAPHSWEPLEDALKRAACEPVEGELKVYGAAPDGIHTIRLLLSPQQIENRDVIRIVADEVTELAHANSLLLETQASLRALSARILQLQDNERRKMARDLHDTTGQELAILVMSLRHLAETFNRPGVDLRKALVEAADLAGKVNDEIRTFSYVLHPPLLDQFGLGSALKWYVDGFSARSGIEVKLVVAQNLNRLSPEKEMALFRVVQEGLTNVLRHSGSKTAKIVVCTSADEVEITVTDQGKGLSDVQVEQLAPGRSSKAMGVGVAGLRERLRQFGGSLEIQSNSVGATLRAILPLDEAEAVLQHTEPHVAPESAAVSDPVSPVHANGRKRILIVDDHEVMRRGIRALLENYADLEICGEAGNGAEALQKAAHLDPDLIILDLSMPGSGGISAANHLKQAGSRAIILVFTTHSFAGMESVLRGAGCKGFVSKLHAERDLVRGVRTVLAGGEFYGSVAHARSASFSPSS